MKKIAIAKVVFSHSAEMNFLLLILLMFASSEKALAVTNGEGSVAYSDEAVTHGDTYYEDFEDPTESVVEEDYYEVLSDEPTSGKIVPFILQCRRLMGSLNNI